MLTYIYTFVFFELLSIYLYEVLFIFFSFFFFIIDDSDVVRMLVILEMKICNLDAKKSFFFSIISS